jgi:hypothetical protein
MPSAVATISPANVQPLPVPGNVQAQLSQAQGYVSKFSTATTPGGAGQQAAISDLLGAGITMIGSAVGGTGQSLIRTMVSIGSSVAAGAAVGGPFGAAAGAIVGLGQAIAQIFQNGPPVYAGFVVQSTAGSGRLAALVAAWQGMNEGITSGAAQGESFGSYLVTQAPPTQTLRPRLMWELVNQAGGDAPPVDAQGNAMRLVGDEGGGGFGGASWPPTQDDITNAQTYLGLVQPIDLALISRRPDPSNAATSTATYEASFQQISQQGSRQLWQDDTKAIAGPHGMSVADIMASALRRAPDPLYFAQDLYIGATGDVQGNTYTLVMNTAAASGLATVLGLLAVGAKTQAIVSELELQQKVLELLDYSAGPEGGWSGTIAQLEADLAPGNLASAAAAGRPYSAHELASLKAQLAAAKAHKTAPPIPPLFRLLVEDYIALAHLEVKNPNASMRDVIAANRPYEPGASSASATSSASSASSAKAAAGATIQRWLNFYLGGAGG